MASTATSLIPHAGKRRNRSCGSTRTWASAPGRGPWPQGRSRPSGTRPPLASPAPHAQRCRRARAPRCALPARPRPRRRHGRRDQTRAQRPRPPGPAGRGRCGGRMDAQSPEAPGGEALRGAVSGDPGPPRVLEPRPGGNWGRVAGGRPHLPGARKPARAETPRPGKPETKVGPCVLRKRRHDVQTEPAVYETFCAIFMTRDSSGADGQANDAAGRPREPGQRPGLLPGGWRSGLSH